MNSAEKFHHAKEAIQKAHVALFEYYKNEPMPDYVWQELKELKRAADLLILNIKDYCHTANISEVVGNICPDCKTCKFYSCADEHNQDFCLLKPEPCDWEPRQ